jgi:hypothetical protein
LRAVAARVPFACVAGDMSSASKPNRAKPIEHDRMLYRQQHKIENALSRIRD